MKAPSLKLFHHTATIKAPTIAENNYGTDQVTSYTDTTGVICRIEEKSSNVLVEADKFTSVKSARGCFPAGTVIAKLYRISVTGPGYASATTFRVVGGSFDSAGANAMVIVDLERESA